jgi:hypothetical protein
MLKKPIVIRLPTDATIYFVTNTVKPSRQTSPQAHADEQHKHHMNQMVVYKKQLETPLMMGL